MDASSLSAFVSKRIELLPTRFTLIGSPISAKDIASPTGLLPLVALYINELHNTVHGNKTASAPILEPADPKTHLLCSEVSSLPDAPEGWIHLLANSAILMMAREPAPALDLPRDLSESSLPATSELMPHISKFNELVLSPLANPSAELVNTISR